MGPSSTGSLCPTCNGTNAAGMAYCAHCGHALPATTGPAPSGLWGPIPPTEGATVFSGPVLATSHQAPQAAPSPPPADASRRSPWLLVAAVGLPILALLTAAILLITLRSGCGDGCVASPAPPPVTSAPAAPAGGQPLTTTTVAPPPTPGAPTITAGTPALNGAHVFIPLTLATAADKPITTCSASASGKDSQFDCPDGKFEYDGTYNTQESVTITVANAAGESSVAAVPVVIPPLRTPIIHACSPPPCEAVSTHAAPHRNTNEEPSFGDGTLLEIDCWVTGDAYQTQFVVAGQPTRTTQIFYQMLGPARGRYVWAPFVTEQFEQPVAGVKQC